MDIVGESHKLEVAKRLVRKGKKVIIKDRSAIVDLVRRTYGLMFDYEIGDDTAGEANTSAAKKQRTDPTSDMGNPMSSYIR